MYFCRSWVSNMVSFIYVLVFLNFLLNIFSIKFYTISFLCKHNFFIDEKHTQWMLDTKVKVFHESISCFMKWPWNCISWNALKEKFHSVSFPSEISQNSQENTCTRVSFLIGSQAFRLQIPKNFLKLFKSTYFEELLQTIASAPLLNEYSRMKERVSKINEICLRGNLEKQDSIWILDHLDPHF